jgi:predicted nuclease with TOPRIM domain
MTGIKDIVVYSLAGLLLAALVTGFILKLRVDTLKTTVKLYEERERTWEGELSDCAQVVEDLQVKIDEQNAVTEENARLGTENARLQSIIDRQARSIASIDNHLERLMEEQQRFDELVSDADTCQTYELALASIAGEIQ